MARLITIRARCNSATGVDYGLGQEFPTTASSQWLQYAGTDDAELETLPVIHSDGCVVIMLANHGVNSSTDNNGPG
jgi:hypothetical protein